MSPALRLEGGGLPETFVQRKCLVGLPDGDKGFSFIHEDGGDHD
jgi:hypothetical protein